MSRRYGRLVLAGVCAGLLVWVGWTWWATRRHRAAMRSIESTMSAGRFGKAARDLEGILSWTTAPDEAAYVLGLCEQKLGHPKAADDAWARVPPGSAFTERALLARLRLLHDSGRLAAAEDLILGAAEDPRNDRTYMLVLLVPILSETGRTDEAERLLEDQWENLRRAGSDTQEASVKLVRLHIELTARAPSVENLRAFLGQAGRMAPDDDRVWLGRANLAIRTGALEEARRWLDACRQRRPEDVPIWRARLRRALAAGDAGEVHEALRHIPAADSSAAQLHRIRAWLCSRQGNLACERRELEHLLATDPADPAALDRLVQLEATAGQSARAADLERQKQDIAAARSRYEQRYERTQPIRDAEEMAQLAARLGRTFEARVFLDLAISEEPERQDLRQDLARLDRSREKIGSPGQSLAQVLTSHSGRDERRGTAPDG